MPDEPATKQDVRDLQQRIDLMQDQTQGQLGQMRDYLGQMQNHLVHMEDHLIEKMRDMQTEVLRAFHNWASPTEIKMRSHEERLTLMEERLRQIERGRLEH